MTGQMKPEIAPSAPELTIIRLFDAPRALVFAAWSEPRHLARWSGPAGFASSQDFMDFRVGGGYRACLRSPDGVDHWVRGQYREIVAPERIVMTHAWEDQHGRPGPETLITISFADRGGRTEMHFRQAGFTSQASRDGHHGGWSSSFERLADYLAGPDAANPAGAS